MRNDNEKNGQEKPLDVTEAKKSYF